MPFGPLELLILLFIVLLIFGARRVPDIGRSLGSSMREFKDGITSFGADDDERRELDRGERRPDTASESSRSKRTTV